MKDGQEHTVDMTAVVNASGIEPNDMLVKASDDGTAMAWMDADNGGIYIEGAVDKKAFGEGIAVAKTATDTFIRFLYTGDANTDVTLQFVVRYQPLTTASLIAAV